MGKINETVRTANSALRTLLFAVLVAGAGFAGWQGYSLYNEPQKKLAEKEQELETARKNLANRQQQVEKLTTDLQAKAEQLERTETSLRLLKQRHRIARIRVLDQQPIPESEPPRVLTTVEFFEVNGEGVPIDEQRRKFEIEGDRIYVECLVAKFEDEYIEAADLDRATAICLFQRIFGEYQQPQEGFPLDQVGSSPTSYARGGKMSDFEQHIWDDFWEFAGDPEKAAEIGIRAAHADAPSTKVKKGVTYQLEMRSTGEFTLMPLAERANR
ncbi:MAG: hypothetical protein GXP24_01035 [Planctomycetes bacterium]|nr:hypothetical protein [Planctomycetota bacterium]